MKPILVSLLIIILLQCAKDYSYEGGLPITPTDTIRTTPNELITSCSIFIEDESKLKWIYPEMFHKYHYQTYKIFDSIRMDNSHQYNRTYDLKNYLQIGNFNIGDSFFIRYEIRWKVPPAAFVQEDTLVY